MLAPELHKLQSADNTKLKLNISGTNLIHIQNGTIFWDFPVNTSRIIKVYRPDITVEDQEN